MKKLFVLILGLITTCTMLSAQQPAGGSPKPPSAEERLKRVSEKLKTELQLSAKQQTVVSEAFKSFFKEADKLRPQSPSPSPPPDKAKSEPLAEKRDASIKAVLTEAQYKKYIELEKTLRPQGPPGGYKPPKQ
ncbi:MAG: hypothetical protein ACOYVG_00490 [Bacteroidota bacterium]